LNPDAAVSANHVSNRFNEFGVLFLGHKLWVPHYNNGGIANIVLDRRLRLVIAHGQPPSPTELDWA
jgi:hypothetical protein